MRSNAAYDLAQYEVKQPQRPRVQVAPAQKTRSKGLGFATVFYAVIIIALMSITVYSRMVLTETEAAIASKQEKLTELQSMNAYLNYQVESLVSLKSAEEYAKTELGLVKLSAGRIEYVTLEKENKIKKEPAALKFEDAVSEFFDSVILYLKGQ